MVLEVSIKDEGKGFDYNKRTTDIDPEELFKSSGRGLLLIQSLMDNLDFEDDGRLIRMKKNRIFGDEVES